MRWIEILMEDILRLTKEFGIKRGVTIEVVALAYGMFWAGVIARLVGLFL